MRGGGRPEWAHAAGSGANPRGRRSHEMKQSRKPDGYKRSGARRTRNRQEEWCRMGPLEIQQKVGPKASLVAR